MTDGVLLGLALISIFVGAVAQASTGLGFSLVAAPFLVAAFGPHEGVAATVVLAALASVAPLVRNRGLVQTGAVLWLLVPTLLCTPLVAWAIQGVETRWLSLAGGVGVIVAAGLLASGLRSRWLQRPGAVVAAGAASAALNVVGGVGGPPIGLYAANADWEPSVARANLQAFFLVQNVVTALVLGVRLPDLAQLVVLGCGTAAGLVLAARLPPNLVRAGVLAVSFAGGAWLVATSL